MNLKRCIICFICFLDIFRFVFNYCILLMVFVYFFVNKRFFIKCIFILGGGGLGDIIYCIVKNF